MTIRLEAVRAGYVPGADVLHDVALEVGEGEIVALIGPNGSGKSTVLKVMIGALAPGAGRVTLDDEDVTPRSMLRRIREHRIGYVPQIDNVFTTLTVAQHLEIGGLRMPKDQRRRQASTLIALFPILKARLNTRTGKLSGGERQIVAISRALMATPRLLLLDEPSAGLSPRMMEEVFKSVLRACRSEGFGVVLVEQNVAAALEISDRCYVLVGGRIVEHGSAVGFLERHDLGEMFLCATSWDAVPASATDGN